MTGKQTTQAKIEALSIAYFDAFSAHVRSKDWTAVYGGGPGASRIEVQITKTTLEKFEGGIGEIRHSRKIPEYAHSLILDQAIQNIAEIIERDPRIDGYISELDCFWEAKVSKFDRGLPKNMGQSIYDIGQWAEDLIRLREIGKLIPDVGLIYSIAAITVDAKVLRAEQWLTTFRRKLAAELAHDLARDEPQLLDEELHRPHQLKTLIFLLGLPSSSFHVVAADRWAIISIDVRALMNFSKPEGVI